MSYDLQVFGQRALSADDLRGVVHAAGLEIDDAGSSEDSLMVVRGARRTYCFMLAMPVQVEAEDVLEEVTAVVLAPTALYELFTEGSSPTAIPHVVRFARRLAREAGGAVLDQNPGGGVWARGRLREVVPVERGTIDTVELRWYTRPETSGSGTAQAWLDLARRHLPEALPRRFGSFEPLPMRLDTDGAPEFVRSVAEEDMNVYFKASRPCLEGGLAGGAGRKGARVHYLVVHRQALADPRWRDALRRLFTDFAAASGTFFASAEVVRGLDWSGRSVYYGATAEPTIYLAPQGRWLGLPPYPVWWTWFGPDYVPLVADLLPDHELSELAGGLFHARGDVPPVDRDQLPVTPNDRSTRSRTWLRWRQRRRGWSSSRASWLPADLLAGPDDGDWRSSDPPLQRARVVPRRLRHP